MQIGNGLNNFKKRASIVAKNVSKISQNAVKEHPLVCGTALGITLGTAGTILLNNGMDRMLKNIQKKELDYLA